MSNEVIIESLIEIPSFLSDSEDYGISLFAIDCSSSCQSCEANPEACGSSQSECNSCQGLSCEGSSQGSCTTTCQTNICQSTCESVCNSTCQGCQSSCQNSCQSCQSTCEVYYQKPDLSLWTWSGSNGSATASQTLKAYTAITSHGETTDFSYLVWNDLVEKVYTAISEDGGNWDTRYATYSNTLMSSSDKVLTAVRFNSLRYNVGLHESTGITEKSSGDKVLGEYFTTITSSLNTYIGTILDS